MEADQQEKQMAAQMMSAVGQGAEVLQQVKAING